MAGFSVKVEFDEEKFHEAIEEFKKNNPDCVEVVRCKDCEQFCWNEGLSDNLTGFCFEHDITVLGVDFCSYGER